MRVLTCNGLPGVPGHRSPQCSGRIEVKSHLTPSDTEQLRKLASYRGWGWTNRGTGLVDDHCFQCIADPGAGEVNL